MRKFNDDDNADKEVRYQSQVTQNVDAQMWRPSFEQKEQRHQTTIRRNFHIL